MPAPSTSTEPREEIAAILKSAALDAATLAAQSVAAGAGNPWITLAFGVSLQLAAAIRRARSADPAAVEEAARISAHRFALSEDAVRALLAQQEGDA